MTMLLIQAKALQEKLNRDQCLVFDVRHDLSDPGAGRRAYEAGRIPGAIFLDSETQLCAPSTSHNGRHPLPDQADFRAFMRSQGVTDSTEVVAYDGGNSMFAARLWWLSRWVGHETVSILDGGWDAWLANGGKIETFMSEARTGIDEESQAKPGLSGLAMPTVDVNAVMTNLNSPRFTIVDARAAERFRGEVEPIDPVAGHIPGALNRPFMQNLDSDGRFKSSAQLRTEFEALLGSRPPTDIVHQCGSGITACHNLFAMELAGMRGSALYPGSWSEWCSDLTRPFAQGSE